MATHGKRLGETYAKADGADLLEALGAHQETAILEAFWRYHSADVAAEAARPIFASRDKELLSLVLDEILDPTLGEPAPQAIVNAIEEHQSPLMKADAERLATRLHVEDPLHPHYEPTRPSLLAWLVVQPGTVGSEAALAVIAGRVAAFEHENVRQAAYVRCRGNARLRGEAAAAVAVAFEQAPSPQAFQQAAEYVEQVCREETTTPDPLRPLVHRLVETAPDYFSGTDFGETLQRLAIDSALEIVEHHLSENLPDSQGARAVLGLLPAITPAQRRAALWATAARTQQALWPLLQQQTTAWEEAEWRRVLRALTSPEPVYRPALEHVVTAAPIELTGELSRLVIAQVGVGDALITAIGQRLRDRLQALGDASETRDAWVAAVYWPKQRDEEALEEFSAILGCLEVSQHVRLLVRGYLAKKLGADVAARLVPAEEVERALKIIRAGQRSEWSAALAVAHPDGMGDAAGAVTTPDGYDLSVVAGLAPVRPDVAFAGVAAAWPRLAVEQRDELLVLLEAHGDVDSIDALSAIIRDDHRGNAKRRVRAARRMGELLEPDATLPEPLLDLLNSNLHELRSAAVDAIARVKPRDPELIGRLHDVVAGRGAAGKAATEALDALAQEFVSEFADVTEKTELHEFMPLLSAVGRTEVLRPLFEYVGSNAVYDDPVVHRTAASAIRSAAERIDEVSADDQELLVQLIDGEQQETDVAAHDDLSEALARLQLGEDAALKVLYDKIGITPKIEPDRLFGSEKEPLVRQLALYDRARKRGQDGWGAELAHMDNIAERLVRAAYLVAEGTSASIVEQIKSDSRTPDYGNLITALASTKQLNGIQAQCKVLHDARGSFSEIPHAGRQAGADTMTTARTCFTELAKQTVGTLQAHHRAG